MSTNVRELVSTAQDLRERSFPDALQMIAMDVSNMVMSPLAEIREFSDRLSVEVPKLVADLNAGNRPDKPLEFVLRVTADPEVMSKFEADLTKV